jgi:transcription antitermination factor NusB
MVGPRRRSRAIALQIMHQMDVSPEMDAEAALSLYFGQLAGRDDGGEDDGGEDDGGDTADGAAHDDVSVGVGDGDMDRIRGAGPIDRALVEELIRGVWTHRDELDRMLAGLSKNWRVERMALVDRNVIRLALFELKHCPDVPVNVAINEAIELAKLFGSGEAGAFVNGLLDRALTDLDLRR